MDVYVSGVGMTKFGKSNDPLKRMMANASRGHRREMSPRIAANRPLRRAVTNK